MFAFIIVLWRNLLPNENGWFVFRAGNEGFLLVSYRFMEAVSTWCFLECSILVVQIIFFYYVLGILIFILTFEYNFLSMVEFVVCIKRNKLLGSIHVVVFV